MEGFGGDRAGEGRASLWAPAESGGRGWTKEVASDTCVSPHSEPDL